MIKSALSSAKKSNHPRFKMGAVVVKGSRILATGYNQVSRGCRVITHKRWNNTLHAEASAILILLKKKRLHDLAGADLYVTRINKVGHTMLAYPCEFCLDLARSVGISKIYYSTNAGETECLKI